MTKKVKHVYAKALCSCGKVLSCSSGRASHAAKIRAANSTKKERKQWASIGGKAKALKVRRASQDHSPDFHRSAEIDPSRG